MDHKEDLTQHEIAVRGEAASKAKTSRELYAQMERLGTAPLWDRYNRLTPPEPLPRDPGFQWRWEDLQPIVERACQDVSMEEAERRVIMLMNPAFQPMIASTCGLYCAVQILCAGEWARNHRHSASAFRFVIQGNGGYTTVEGKPCVMNEGDLILTPNWTWHEHHNPTSERVLWLDGLDVPLIYFYNAMFSDHGATGNFRPQQRDLDDRLYAVAGLAPDAEQIDRPFSPKFRYPWADVVATLENVPPAKDGVKRVQYTNPLTGGPVMPTMDLYVVELPRNTETRPRRTTANAIAYVVEGEGETRYGEKLVKWRKHDIFTLPHWSWTTHKAYAASTRLFLNTDRALLRRLDYLREEVG